MGQPVVVAADDGIRAQTIEAIIHAKAANVPIIIAINEIDKPDSGIDRVKRELLFHDLVDEEFGGDVMIIPVPALQIQAAPFTLSLSGLLSVVIHTL